MKYIANILTQNLFKDNNLYNVVSSKKNLISGIPTLCIGKEFTKSNYPDFSVIEFKVEDGVYWTYGPREKRNIYEDRLLNFNELAIKSFIESIEYVFINVFTIDSSSVFYLRFLKAINSEEKTTSLIYNDMAYVYDNNFNCVYGVSLRDLRYKNCDYKKLISLLYKKTRVINIKEDVPYEVKSSFYVANYAIPCLYY